MVTVQVVPESVSQPLQPVKMERKPGVAVRVTTVPLVKEAEQVAPQLIPAGLDVTVPLAMRPVLLTVRVKRCTATVKLLALVAVPPGVVTLSGPVVAPLGTVAEIEVEEVAVKLALVPLNRTAEAPVKFVPVIVTGVPTGPLVGAKLVIVGAGVTAAVSPPSQPMKANAGVYASIPTSPVA